MLSLYVIPDVLVVVVVLNETLLTGERWRGATLGGGHEQVTHHGRSAAPFGGPDYAAETDVG